MGSRIMTLKRQQVQLGRIRTGYSVPNKDPEKQNRAVRSETFIFTSHSRDYVAAAAEQWGGDVEPWTPQRSRIGQFRVITKAREIRAIMPTGDPLSQAYEKWGGGGCERRCDGEREQKSGEPCICLARFGTEWYRRSPKQVCRPATRVSVMLPELPDLGVWRLDTHSYYAADGMAGSVDTVLQATGGESMMPVRMWIESTTRVEDGETKTFPVVKLVPAVPKLRHALSGPLSTAAALDPSSLVDRPVLEAAPAEVPDYLAEARGCTTSAAVIGVWHKARAAGHGSDELLADLKQIADDVERGVDPRTGVVEDDDQGDGPDDEGVYDVEVVGEVDAEPPTAYPAAAWPEAAQPGGGA